MLLILIWTCSYSGLRRGCFPGVTRNPIVLDAVSTHYPTPSSSNVAYRSSINARVITSRILDSPARATVRSVLYKCIPYTRERVDVPVELMSNLPAARVNRTARAFVHTGVDYSAVRTTPDRGHKSRAKGLFRIMLHDQSSTLRARQRLYLSYFHRSVSMICFSPRTTYVHVFR